MLVSAEHVYWESGAKFQPKIPKIFTILIYQPSHIHSHLMAFQYIYQNC